LLLRKVDKDSFLDFIYAFERSNSCESIAAAARTLVLDRPNCALESPVNRCREGLKVSATVDKIFLVALRVRIFILLVLVVTTQIDILKLSCAHISKLVEFKVKAVLSTSMTFDEIIVLFENLLACIELLSGKVALAVLAEEVLELKLNFRVYFRS
jgi:hypothetical protein